MSGAGSRDSRRWCPPIAVVLSVWLSGVAAAALPFQYSQQRVDVLNPVLKPIDPQGIAVSPDGTQLYVTEKGNRVFRYAPDGSYLGGWGGGGSAPGLFNDPRGITTDPYGAVYVADLGNNRVQKFTADGKFMTAWDSPGAFAVAADDVGDVYVLSTSFTAVSVRSYDGFDFGGFLAHFPSGFTALDWYDAPRNTATALVAAGDGVLVAGTVAQNRSAQPRKCLVSGITGHGPQPLPDPLSGPAVALFAANGTSLDEAFVAWLGAPCWATPASGESFGMSGALEAGAPIALDPADGSVFVAPIRTDDRGVYHIYRLEHSTGDVAGQLDEVIGLPSAGPPHIDERASTAAWGSIRSLAIDCQSSMYVLMAARIFRYRAAAPATGRCFVQSPLGIALGLPKLETVKGKTRHLSLRLVCGAEAPCDDVVRVKLLPKDCPRCRLPLAMKPFRAGAGEVGTVTFRLSGRVRRALRADVLPDVVAEVRRRHHREVIADVQTALRLPRAVTLACGASLTGHIAPADGAGTDVELWLEPPVGAPVRQVVHAGADGSFEYSPSLTTAGTWSVVAHVSEGARLADATADCDATVGSVPAAFDPSSAAGTTAVVPGGPLAALVSLSCPVGAVPFGTDASADGALDPALGGEQIAVTFTAPPGSGLPAVQVVGTVGSDGAFTATFTPAVSGTWSAQASWPGDTDRLPATSAGCAFLVG
ncbi:MAG: NHL repeat-containing protein [Candidatus Binatia bacterium]